MMQTHNVLNFALRFLVLTTIVVHFSISESSAFPFREIEKGGAVPDVQLVPMEKDTATVNFANLKGKPFIAVFWGADLPEKIEYSAKILGEIEALGSFFDARNVERLSVNVQNDSDDAITEVIQTSSSSLDTYLDENKAAYAALGIYVIPAILVVDKDGKIAAGMGYSHDVGIRLKGSVEIMLGEKTEEQVAAELRPEMKEASDEDKQSRRHLNFGIVMMKRGLFDAAIREFSKAIEINPDMIDARLHLGCLYLDRMEITNAEYEITKVLEADPQSVPGKICMGELLRLKKQLADANQLLQGVIQSDQENYKAKYHLARVLEDQDKKKEAMDSYKQAYLEIVKQSVMNK